MLIITITADTTLTATMGGIITTALIETVVGGTTDRKQFGRQP